MTRIELEYTSALGFARTVVPDDDPGAAEGATRESTQITANNHRGRAAFELYFSPVLYWRIIGGYVSFDELQGIALRAQPGTLLGWEVLDGSVFSLELGIGGGYQHTSFIDDAVPSINTGGPVATVHFEWDPKGVLETTASSSAFGDLGLDNGDNQSTIYNRLDFDVDLGSIFDLSFGFIHEFVAEPQGTNPNTGGPVQQNDFQFIVGLSVSIH